MFISAALVKVGRNVILLLTPFLLYACASINTGFNSNVRHSVFEHCSQSDFAVLRSQRYAVSLVPFQDSGKLAHSRVDNSDTSRRPKSERLILIIKTERYGDELQTLKVSGLNPLGAPRFKLEWRADSKHSLETAPMADASLYKMLSSISLMNAALKRDLDKSSCSVTIDAANAISINGTATRIQLDGLDGGPMRFSDAKQRRFILNDLRYNITLSPMD